MRCHGRAFGVAAGSVTLLPEARMARRSKHESTAAEARFHALVDELRLLTMDFPHLKEAYDANDLPIPFLLKRGAARAAAATKKNRKKTKKTAPPG
jgi:hypothetical protein